MALIRTSGSALPNTVSGTPDALIGIVREASASIISVISNGTATTSSSGLPAIPADFFVNPVTSGDNLTITYRTAGEYFESYTINATTNAGIVKRSVGDVISLPAQSSGTLKAFNIVKMD